jgi:hypothetical protein
MIHPLVEWWKLLPKVGTHNCFCSRKNSNKLVVSGFDLKGKTWAWNLGFYVKEVVFSAKLCLVRSNFASRNSLFTVDFILIGKYLLADSLHLGRGPVLRAGGTPLLREGFKAKFIYPQSRDLSSLKGRHLKNCLLLIFLKNHINLSLINKAGKDQWTQTSEAVPETHIISCLLLGVICLASVSSSVKWRQPNWFYQFTCGYKHRLWSQRPAFEFRL